MENTFIQLNDTPSDFTGHGLKFVKIKADATGLSFANADLNSLEDVELSGGYIPEGGQILQYSSGAGKWRPVDNDPYSAGNGLNKTGTTLQVTALGGLVANSSGLYIEDIANVAGTHGNSVTIPQITVNSKGQITAVTELTANVQTAQYLAADYVGNVLGTSGAIRITGGTGNNSNATVDLVATGVTSGTYGNSTHIPQITVDTYGRIQNIDLIEGSGNIGGGGGGEESGDGLSLSEVQSQIRTQVQAYKTITIAGQTQLAADRFDDNLTLIAGSGITLATNAANDSITISSTSGGGGGGVTQSLSWNSGTSTLSISDGNSIDLSALRDNTDTQNLSLSGNVISLSNGGNVDLTSILSSGGDQTLSLSGNVISLSNGGNVDLTSTLSDVAGNYGDSNVISLVQNLGSNVVPSSNNIYSLGSTSNRWTELYLSGNSIFINGSTLSETGGSLQLNGNSLATVDYVNAEVANIIGAANVNLDSLAEVANALNNSNSQLSTVAFTGNFADIQSRPTISLSGSDLTYDGTTLDLSGLGAQGPQGDGNAGISTAIINGSGNLIITLNDATVIDAGLTRGADGADGAPGVDGIDGTDGSDGADGADGADGVGITSTSIVGGNLVLNYSNTSTQDVGSIQGPQGNVGPAGNDGVDVSSATVNGSGNLIITLSDASTVDAGNVKGTDGANTLLSLTDVSADGTNGQVLTTDGNGSFSFTTVSGGSGTTYTGSTGITVDNTANTVALSNTSVTPGTYGTSTKSARITVDQQGRITSVTESTISGGGGGGGGGASIERFKLNYSSSGQLSSTSDLSDGIANVTIDSASGGEVTIEFDDGTYNLPPGSIMMYGYDHTNNKYNIVPLETSMGFREIAAGGSSGSPTLFDGSNTLEVKLRLREAETGASRGGFGTTTHAWIQFVMYD